MTQSNQSFWCYNIRNSWLKREYPMPLDADDISTLVTQLGFDHDPSMMMGDEMNFFAVFENLNEDEYLFHLEIEDVVKVFFADSMPAMMHLVNQCNDLINNYFKTSTMLKNI